MSNTWKVTIAADQRTVEGALLAQEDAVEWDPAIVVSGTEIPAGATGAWQFEAWLPREPTATDKAAIAALFAEQNPDMLVERLPDIDWISESQKGIEPIRAGRFYVHTPEHPASHDPDAFDFVIPAGQAFGTGQHETTAGCLSMLTTMKQRGMIVRNCADIGTGTGLLAFAALKLWPRAIVTASDIDPVSTAVTIENAELNGIPLGARGGELTITIANGMAHPLIAARGPYDLIVANILAGPLIELAPAFSRALVPGGSLLLAGLMTAQEEAVRSACRRAGMRIAARKVDGDWSILWMRKRTSHRARSVGAIGAVSGAHAW